MKHLPSDVRFEVALHHLAPGGVRAGPAYPDSEHAAVTASELRVMLEALAAIAPQVEFPAEPEMRIVSPHGRFLVQVREGRVRFSSWALKAGAAEFTPDQILAAISGVEAEDESATTMSGAAILHALAPARMSKWKAFGLTAAAILATNSFTVWFFIRPAPTLLPEYQLIEGPPGVRLLAGVAGEFETGRDDGDRLMSIKPDGAVRWVLLGERGIITEDTRLTSRPVTSRGKPALLTSNHALIEILDPVTLVLYGDTYRRKSPRDAVALD